jgi:hypothetical protein
VTLSDGDGSHATLPTLRIRRERQRPRGR